ncbi:MAG: sn-glycerol-3-phosphate ABC transporter ATP-binding protein UgpC [Kiritimatiellae bacterium]|nr:sn-glycerol-3-phosphate ABC transporter ATP-binding protein UgpC [Kiritimatiellia bacterium]MDD4735369.1 sn-glycerol-3-phosphate ABC transporter ATP-binding protein UgpC [Kiritimatiellia bacterium]
MGKVTLEHVFKIYPGNVTVVDDVNLEIQDKEFLVLVGPSGCGKSTTLRMVAGLEEISRGTISIDGRVVNEVPPKDRDIAMVFQNYALYPHMTVYKNMAYGLIMRGYPKEEIDTRVREAAEILGITPYLDRKPKALSGGQRQRVAVGRAIVRKPKVFLFDEPLSNLDAKMRVQMRAEISKLHKKLQATIIYVTHDQVEAMTMGTRIVVMKNGIIQQVAAPLDLFHNPKNKFVAGFIGSPPMNFFDGRIRSEGSQVIFDEGVFSLTLPDRQAEALRAYAGKEVVLGVRPGDVHQVKNAPESAKPYKVDARVEVVEPMGDEVYIYLDTGKHSFTARSSEFDNIKIGEEYRACFNMAKTHFFDRETDATII